MVLPAKRVYIASGDRTRVRRYNRCEGDLPY
jgi:hypothetical protein